MTERDIRNTNKYIKELEELERERDSFPPSSEDYQRMTERIDYLCDHLKEIVSIIRHVSEPIAFIIFVKYTSNDRSFVDIARELNCSLYQVNKCFKLGIEQLIEDGFLEPSKGKKFSG